jgi:DNA (cytosine-5)-methyltransferase 1
MEALQSRLDLEILEESSKATIETWSEVLGIELSGAWQQLFGKKIHEFMSKQIPRPVRVLSLFSGVGGLDIGFHQAGFTIVEMVEIEKQFFDTLKKNSLPGGLFEGSIPTKIDICEYEPKELGKIDFIIGGPPCQTFSAAGRRSHGVLGTDDDRGNLFKEYVRLLKKLEPEGFLFENVYGIEGAQGGGPWREIVQSFSEIGYKLEYRVLDAADYGVPQHRERLIIVGTRSRQFKFPKPTHGPDSSGKINHECANDALFGLNDFSEPNNTNGIGGRYGHLLPEIPAGLNYSYYTEKLGHPSPIFAWRSKFSDFLYKADPTKPVRTIKAQGGKYTGPFHWKSRPFTVEELKRLQTIPDDFQITGSVQKSIQQIGNSVPPQFARLLGLAVMEQVFDVNLPAELPKLQPSDVLTFRKRKREKTSTYLNAAALSEKLLIKNQLGAATIDSKSKRFDLTEQFELTASSSGKFEIKSRVVKNSLVISAKELNSKHSTHNGILSIKPKKSWEFEFSNIDFQFKGKSPNVVVACWKALERYLNERNLRNDLVQLGGYYQYESNLEIKFEFVLKQNRKSVWRLLQKCLEVGLIGKSIKYEYAAELLEIEISDLIDFMSQLRELGFEIRNRNTNSQIPGNTLLIPYIFPTLNSRSVQLRKSVS